ncbi:MAG: hypothetical protein HY363_03950 [Candidatus Aenigmarchaeota archaeon]|nr:hypothetical protein [Candidatus Aenigmarchaeota archaeon]
MRFCPKTCLIAHDLRLGFRAGLHVLPSGQEPVFDSIAMKYSHDNW